MNYQIQDDHIIITKNPDAKGDLAISVELDGKPITSISFDSFNGCADLTSVDIPAGLTTIEKHTFYGCMNLTLVTVPDSVSEIGAK